MAAASAKTFRLDEGPGAGTRPQDEPPRPARLLTVVGVSRDVAGFRFTESDDVGMFLPTSVTAPTTSIAARVKGDSDRARRALVDRLVKIDPNMGLIVTMRTLARLAHDVRGC